VESGEPQYRRCVPRGSGQAWPLRYEVRPLVPFFALAVAIVAALTDPSSPADLILAALPVAAFAVWAYLPRAPLWAACVGVLVPVVVAQGDGELEPLLFDASLLGFVVGRWAPTRAAAVALGLLTLSAPVAASLIQDPAEIAVGIWLLGIAFPWFMGRVTAHQRQLLAQLDATRRELAEQALHEERRRIARDVHDFVGHGLAALMLQITSARHVLRRDPAAAEEALKSAEEVGRRSMRELRGTVMLLRRDDESAVAPPLPTVMDIAALVDDARAGGLDVALQREGDLSRLAPTVGVTLYRITQEALANAARHAPNARTALEIAVDGGGASLVVDSDGPIAPRPQAEPTEPRYGLVGMRERAMAIGGEFSAGPTARGWRVSCRVPLEAKDEAPIGEGRAR
jgi:signal transduction histidine kinase